MKDLIIEIITKGLIADKVSILKALRQATEEINIEGPRTLMLDEADTIELAAFIKQEEEKLKDYVIRV